MVLATTTRRAPVKLLQTCFRCKGDGAPDLILATASGRASTELVSFTAIVISMVTVAVSVPLFQASSRLRPWSKAIDRLFRPQWHSDLLRVRCNFSHVDRDHPAIFDPYRTGEVRHGYCGTDDEAAKIQKAIFLSWPAAFRMLGYTCELEIKHHHRSPAVSALHTRTLQFLLLCRSLR
jgi:hypothetical protein